MRIRFGHADPAGIAYYPRFFEWFHDAFESMFEPLVGMPYAEVLERFNVGYPAVQVACEFKTPVRFGDLVVVEVFLSRLGERSATFEYRIRRPTDRALVATASVKIAGMSLDEHRSAELPEPVRAAFRPYVEEDGERPDLSRIR